MNFFRKLVTPIGELYVECNLHQVVAVHFGEDDFCRSNPAVVAAKAENLLGEVVRQLELYFAGQLRIFKLPLPDCGSEFQRRVLRQVASIPYGQVATYGDIAASLGQAGAARAVGGACNRNPWPIIIPCHRVIGSNGKNIGYRGGVSAKRWLLDMERRQKNDLGYGGVNCGSS
ncbi:MAG: methylated-DNA--[protein]-cysteine S-methyltransferase [Victivallaceae bacterium]